jgi:VanZ family protein
MIWFYRYCAALIKFSNLRKALFWACFLAINILALSPAPYLPEIFNWWDKAQHAIAFAVLAVLAVLAYPEGSKRRIAFLLIGQGVLIEVLQYFSGYRYGDWQDAVADGVGVLVGMFGVSGLLRVEWFRRIFFVASNSSE